eukprot:TRINITY_DN7086_c0_g1_i1.p1 TRINITY_DN7086_c0_g1~~TRINITY_DN7086_c0_g1_i1.p1  ORF type:complete len:264 (+),score=39.56 TRINITY_DN7086_c0_g1_i1:32-793(+)
MDHITSIGRGEILSFYNDFLSLNYNKIEDTASGAAHCQLMDAIFPGKVALSKVNFNATYDYEFLSNYKVLQSTFNKLGIEKEIPVTTLVKGKHQGNLEFCQWMKRYFDSNYHPEKPYDPIARRSESGCPYTGDKIKSLSKKMTDMIISTHKPSSLPATLHTAHPTPALSNITNRPPSIESTNQLKDKNMINEMREKVASLKLTVDNLERERDFYFSKLREIEILTDNIKEGTVPMTTTQELVNAIHSILYASE